MNFFRCLGLGSSLVLATSGCQSTGYSDGTASVPLEQERTIDIHDNPYERHRALDERVQRHREVSGTESHHVPRNFLRSRSVTGELDLD
ncbi:MAG: hypothetical protein ACFB20_04500 [Opitutales bacterium]